ncbi:major facilitator superfamily efflux pump (plasmid) [Azospirillum sp. B510]|uniref:MFS transporter n=1 Tax=Azospirillum sp. (strain B510) TaxID=137722 RepID=UPI0001C4C9E3|nr:MFS transporter [Azospirillum sp. B510]BAI75740.1 major facilitator superfamily efflux pump [Azospirillum sp. B510]
MSTVSAETPTNRMWVLMAVCLAALALPLGFAGGAVATPAIGGDLGGGPAALNWITNAFMLTFGSSLMAAGALADQFGRKRLFMMGIVAFVSLSLALSLAPSILVLDLLRAGQGFAAAAALAQEFEGRARTWAFSLLGTTFGVGLAFGPLLAGVLIAAFGWRAIFLSGTIIGLLALLLTARRMRESRDPDAVGLDHAGALVFTAMLGLFTYGVIEAPEIGWNSPIVVASLAGSAAMLAALILVETRSKSPMLDLSLFRYPRFVGVQILPVATCYCYVVLLVLLPLRFIGVAGLGEVDAGLLLVALSAPMLVVPLAASYLVRWLPAGLLSAAGLLVAAIGLFWLGRVDPASGGIDVILPMLVIGIGTGLPWGLMDGLSVSVVPKERAGMATGIFSTTRVAGEGVALAIVHAVLAALAKARLAAAIPRYEQDASQAAQRLAIGDVRGASEILPNLTQSDIHESYAVAFRHLSMMLVAITLLSALVVLVLLGRRGSQTENANEGRCSDREPARRAEV